MAVPASETPAISVLICTRNRRDDVARVLASLRADGVPREGVEIVVIEETAEPAPIPGVRYVTVAPEGRGFAYVRNLAVQTARGRLLVFVDDDCEVERGWLDALLAPLLADPGVGGVAGAVLVRDCNAVGYAESILGFPGGGLRYLDAAAGRVVPTAHLSTCNCAYRREAIETAGGFSPLAALGGEDSLLAERVTARWPCRYVPAAVVYHKPRQRLPAVFRWFVRRGRAEMLILPAAAQPAAVVRSLLRGSILLRALALALVLVWLPRPVWITAPALLAVYYAALLRRFAFARRYPTHRRGWWLTPLVKMVADAGAEIGRLRELPGTLRRWRVGRVRRSPVAERPGAAQIARPAISVVLITRDEAARIRACLDSVRWADEIVVVDQHSRDDTAAICRAYGARVIERDMTAGFGEQKNFAVTQATHSWILSLDADEEVTPALRCAIEAAVTAPGGCVGFRMPRLTSYLGRFIRHCGWYPSPVLRLFRRDHGRFTDALVHEEVVVDGPVGDLAEDLLHRSYDSLADHVRKLLLYTAYDARMRRRRDVRLGPLSAPWALVLKPTAVFLRKLVLQQGFREGWHGYVLSAMAALVVLVNAVRLAELTGWLGRSPAGDDDQSDPPTVLVLANFAEVVGGGEESLLGLTAALDRRRLRVLGAVTTEGGVAARLRALDVPVSVVALPPVRPWTLPGMGLAWWRLRRLLVRERVAVVHAHGSRGALYAGLAALRLGVPLVWHLRIDEPDPRLDPLLVRLASAIVANSAATSARLGAGPVAAGKVTIVPNGVDLDRFAPRPPDPALREALGLDPALPLVGFFGRLEHGKGVDVLLEAAARVHTKLPSAFLVVGEGPLGKRLAARAAGDGLPVRFAGRRDDVPELMRLCAVVVLPSRREAFGRVLIEAMATGVPVVATSVGGIPEVCVDGVTGLLVPPDDPEALAVAIALTLTDQAATAARVAAAAADVRARFDLAAHAAGVQAVYARMVGSGGAA